ncbi:MAG: hypothetical protein ACRCXZ_00835 [Patescibacteria group bacterium]
MPFFDIILDLLYVTLGVFFGFGFLQLLDIYKNYREDVKQFPPKPAKTFHQIVLPIENNNSIEEMEMFFRTLHTMYFSDPVNQVTFEIHSKAGRVTFYMQANEELFALIRSSLESRFPGVNFILVEDPLASLDAKWTNAHTMYKDFRCAEYVYNFAEIDGLKVSNDLLPSLSWRNIQKDANAPTNDPMNNLISSMEELVDGEYGVFQIILRAQVLGKKDAEKYKGEFDKVKAQLSTNAVKDTSGNALTDEEKRLLNEIQRKRNYDLYSAKIRYGYFKRDDDVKPKLPWYSAPNAFLNQFNTPYQSFIFFTPYSFMGDIAWPILRYLNFFEPKKTSVEFNEKPYTTMDQARHPAYMKILDDPNSVESMYRKKQFYIAIKNREFKYGAKVMNIDLDSLSCIFHFPVTGEKTNVTSKLQNLANETTNTNPANWSTPPANLPF